MCLAKGGSSSPVVMFVVNAELHLQVSPIELLHKVRIFSKSNRA